MQTLRELVCWWMLPVDDACPECYTELSDCQCHDRGEE